jgi:hypothetical protein
MNIFRRSPCLGLLTLRMQHFICIFPSLRAGQVFSFSLSLSLSLSLFLQKVFLKDKSLVFKKECLCVTYFAYKLVPNILFFIEA